MSTAKHPRSSPSLNTLHIPCHPPPETTPGNAPPMSARIVVSQDELSTLRQKKSCVQVVAVEGTAAHWPASQVIEHQPRALQVVHAAAASQAHELSGPLERPWTCRLAMDMPLRQAARPLVCAVHASGMHPWCFRGAAHPSPYHISQHDDRPGKSVTAAHRNQLKGLMKTLTSGLNP